MTDIKQAKVDANKIAKQISEHFIAMKMEFKEKYPDLDLNASLSGTSNISNDMTCMQCWVTIK